MMIFVGRFFPKGLLEDLSYNSYGKAGLSNHNFELSIINGLCRQEGLDLHCLSVPGVYSYPHNNRKFFTKSESYDYKNTRIDSVGFCNLPFVKEIWSTIALAIEIHRLIRICKDERVDVLVNTPDNRLLNAVRIARFFARKRVTQTVIIPDIPSMVTAMDKQNPVKACILKYLNRSSMKKVSESNGLVLLTEAMMDFVHKPVGHIVMEGIVDVGTMDVETNCESPDKKIILYTGTLRKIFGVMNLVNAFQLIEDADVELWICGSGDSKEEIEQAAKNDSRIKYFGLVDSQTALQMQRKATVLVNPRTSEGEYTKYSFPSKTMEYLMAGKCAVINRLPGIPEEYYDYVFTPEDESVEALAECLSQVLAIDEQTSMKRAEAGRNFIINQKNSKVQTKRILDMIDKY
jgi:glycosyltransferase involved in cell wall biosynthesis